jgi:circadian clock protein KaiC
MRTPELHHEQLPTGIAGLDRLSRGGLRRSGLHVIVGRPGSGKSILAHQVGANDIRRHNGTVLYLTALVESHQTLLAQARTFAFFDPSMVSVRFYYASLYPALERGGLEAITEEITRLVRERTPSLIVIDGLHVVRLAAAAHARSRVDWRRSLRSCLIFTRHLLVRSPSSSIGARCAEILCPVYSQNERRSR